MKIRSFLAATAFSCLLSLGASAQSASALRVQIPFEFLAGGQKLAAGDYMVEESGETGALVLRCLATHQSVIVMSAPASARTPERAPGLTFERRNGVVYLSRVLAYGAAPRSLPLRLP